MDEKRPHISLNALRVFEAAGRLGSFLAAAQELNVTPGAVSRQIKTLEEALGVRLFVRSHREVWLSEDARRYRERLTEAFRRIDLATGELLDLQADKPLRVMCSLNVGMRWLLPRLPSFHMGQPGFDVTVTTLQNPHDRKRQLGEADVVLRLGDGEWPGAFDAVSLFPSELVVVCAPRILEEGPPLRGLEDIAHHRLLISAQRPDSWERWSKMAGAPAPDPSMYLTYESSAMAYSAGMEGLGLVLAERALLIDELANGRMVQIFPHALRGPDQFYILTLPNPPARVRVLAKWLVEEGRRTAAALWPDQQPRIS